MKSQLWRDLFSGQQDYSQICPDTLTNPFVWFFSTCRSSRRTHRPHRRSRVCLDQIRFSGVWRRQSTAAREDVSFITHDTNWKSAEDRVSSHARRCRRQFRVRVPRHNPVAKGCDSGSPQRRQIGPTRPTPLLGQHDTKRQRESSNLRMCCLLRLRLKPRAPSPKPG